MMAGPVDPTSDILDASKARAITGGASFRASNRLYRALWNFTWFIMAAWTPPQLHRWRVSLLRLFGARLGSSVHVYSDASIWSPRNLEMGDFACLGRAVNCYNIAPVSIGDYALISQGAHLCTGSHDIDDPHFQLVAASIVIGRCAWIAAESFVGPGVTVGEGAVLGARGVTVRDLDDWKIFAGNPARIVGERKKVFPGEC